MFRGEYSWHTKVTFYTTPSHICTFSDWFTVPLWSCSGTIFKILILVGCLIQPVKEHKASMISQCHITNQGWLCDDVISPIRAAAMPPALPLNEQQSLSYFAGPPKLSQNPSTHISSHWAMEECPNFIVGFWRNTQIIKVLIYTAFLTDCGP